MILFLSDFAPVRSKKLTDYSRRVAITQVLTMAISVSVPEVANDGGQSAVARALEVAILAVFLCAFEALIYPKANQPFCLQRDVGNRAADMHTISSLSPRPTSMFIQPAVTTVL